MNILLVGHIKLNKQTKTTLDNYEPFPGLGKDGPSRNMLNLSLGLANNNHRVCILLSRPIKQASFPEIANITIIPYPDNNQWNPWKSQKQIIKKIINLFGIPDIINFQSVYNPYQVSLAVSFLKKGWEYSVTPRGGLCPFAQKRSFLKKVIANHLFFKRYLKNAKYIVALCQEEKQDIENFDSRLPTVIIPNGVSSKLLLGGKKSIHNFNNNIQSNSDIVIGFLGQLDVSKKGLDLLLQAIYNLSNKNRLTNLAFYFAGGPRIKSDMKTVNKFQKLINLPSKLIFKGPLYDSDKWRFLESINVFIHTSRMEGMPTAVLEALAFAKPCLVTHHSNMGQIIKSANAGWVCKTSTSEIESSLMEVSKQSKIDIAKLGLNGYRYVKKHLEWGTIAKKFALKLS